MSDNAKKRTVFKVVTPQGKLDALGLEVRPGWMLAISVQDMAEWEPESIMPTIETAMEYAENVVRVKPPARVALSSDIVVKVKGKKDCVAIIQRYARFGQTPLLESGDPLIGQVWIGPRPEAKKHRRHVLRQMAAMKIQISYYNYRPTKTGLN